MREEANSTLSIRTIKIQFNHQDHQQLPVHQQQLFVHQQQLPVKLSPHLQQLLRQQRQFDQLLSKRRESLPQLIVQRLNPKITSTMQFQPIAQLNSPEIISTTTPFQLTDLHTIFLITQKRQSETVTNRTKFLQFFYHFFLISNRRRAIETITKCAFL
jgi:hypothetical protein